VQQTNAIIALNAAAGPGLGTFGAYPAGAGHGYASSTVFSSPSTLFVHDGVFATNKTEALANGDYFSFTIGAVPGATLNLNNLNLRANQTTAGHTNTVVLRSSVDGFASDLAVRDFVGGSTPWPLWDMPLAFNNVTAGVEFRLYVYAEKLPGAVIFRIDDLTISGTTGSVPAGTQVVTVAATDNSAAEPGTDTGTLVLTRYGDASSALTVDYAIGGTAANGTDYAALSGTATFPAGQTNLTLTITPLNDALPESTETVVVKIVNGTGYVAGFPEAATVAIADDGDVAPVAPPVLSSITVVGTAVTVNFTGEASDTPASFKLQSAAQVDGTYEDDNAAVITGSAGTFQATTAVNGPARFYRVRR
jgi:hypothetical protein